ncbi:TetR family transcriptional regulator [Streptomyces fructofermentans]|uniref:TetR family transcriptional regulator n=1 Tax=Streptomyces fructofermentans TaxID=152141 RepID=A0A918NMY9_9ACTN|nr:TetR family transcriptional regulator [Streptomyces fructofermentans]
MASIDRVERQVKRQYDTSRRRAAAQATRQAILDAARRLFIERGYAATTMAELAERAGVAVDTVYTVAGRKPALFLQLVESAISGTDDAVPAAERDYVREMRAEPDAARKLRRYARAVREMHARLAPLLLVARAGPPEVAEVWQSIARRRAGNMRLLAADLAATGQLRDGLDLEEVADVMWATNSPEFYCLLVEDRSWPPERFERWLADGWCRLLLA